MRILGIRTAAALVLLTAAAGTVYAQDSTTKGVHIGLQYTPGTRPGVVVLPMLGIGGDSAQAIIQRDLDDGDRLTIIQNVGNAGVTTANVNYALFAKLSARAIVQGFLGPTALHVLVHDVGGQKILVTRDFAVPATVGTPEWRFALHAASDEIEKSITGTRGIAATRVLFVRDGQIYVCDADGYDVKALSPKEGAMSPAWHPSGRYIGYSVFTKAGTEIVIQDLTNGGTRHLVGTPGGLNSAPVFTPDGKWVVYAHGDEVGTDLFAANPFSNDPARRITVGHGTDNTQPTFSPDGQQIAFTSGRSGHPEIYITDFDGTNAELLTPFEFGGEFYREGPDWSPDGRSVAFGSWIGGIFQVETISLRDRSVKQLTSEGRNEDPSYAPDSRHLVFTSTRSGVHELWVLDVESGRVRQLTFGSEARLAAWSRALVPSP
jgi:TolB protein